MGAWGTGVFENDAATELCARFQKRGLSVVRRSLKKINDADASVDLEADACCQAIASAAIVAAALGHDLTELPEIVEERITSLRWLPSAGDIAAAIDAAKRIRKRSELRELWREGKDFVGWSKSVDVLIRCLRRKPSKRAVEDRKDRVASKRKQATAKTQQAREGWESDWTRWTVGEVVAYRFKANVYAILRVASVREGRLDIPTFDLYDWQGSELPQKSEIKKLSVVGHLQIVTQKEDEVPHKRLERLGFLIKKKYVFQGCVVIGWSKLAWSIKDRFGMTSSSKQRQKLREDREDALADWKDWSEGEFIAYRIGRKKMILLQVNQVDKQGPHFSVVEWSGMSLPSSDAIPKLPVVSGGDFFLAEDSSFPADRLERVAARGNVQSKGKSEEEVMNWLWVDRWIKKVLKV